MKSRISNNLDGAADMGTYFEMPLHKFILQMPQYAGMIYNSQIDIEDTNYIVRFLRSNNNVMRMIIGEIGNSNDDWKRMIQSFDW